ncbi:hypothetical protein WKI65_15340 [Streptomyces sp. MS1.AVA.3]|uniref:hypothetical protein n=1 Tax=Streptomyces decoyicus TaxID=249567 RepID=UPI0030BAAD3E
MSSGKVESRALLAVRVIALVPVLWFFLAGAIGKIAGKDWVPVEAYFWPLMFAPVAFIVAYAKYRRDIQRGAGNAPDVRWLYRFAAGLFIFANALLAVFYSWIASIVAALCLVILLDSLINRLDKEAT